MNNKNLYFSKPVRLIIEILIGIFAFSCIFPFIYVIIISFSSEKSILNNGYQLIPSSWSWDGYIYLWKMRSQLLMSVGTSLFVTIVGTILTVLLTTSYAYAISRTSFAYRKFFTFAILVTMLFSGGLVPTYIVMTQMLHLKNTVWALILPLSFSPFYVIVMRTFFKKSVPEAIIESARIDGLSEIGIFFKIVIPLSLPGIATIALFSTLGYWNDWFNALLYADNSTLLPLQYMLMKIQNTMDFMAQNAQAGGITAQASILNSIPKESVRMAMVVVATLPIALTYPFFQRYFVEGLTIGGVKE